MYCIQQMVTTGQTSMNHIPLPDPKPPVVYPAYRHPYGGIARDIDVTREGFMRFFELDELGMKLIYHPDFYGKVLDRLLDNHELIGYRGHSHGREIWTITIIDRTHGALMDYAVRNTVPNPQN